MATAFNPQAAAGPLSAAPQILPAPRTGRWFGVALILLVATWIAYQVMVNPGFQWQIVGRYMLHADVLAGVAMTLQLTALVMVMGTIIGIAIALMRLSGDPVLGFCAHAFVWFFRGTPVLVQLVFWYNLASLFPELSLGIPFGGPKFFEISATVAISSFTAAMLGLGLNEAAYMAEIVRAGMLSVDPGQKEASKALGHRPWQTFRVVVLPQAMKAIVPPTGNQVIGMLKYTSIASVVALGELMHSVENIYSRTFETIPLLIVAALWYLIMVSILSVFQYFIERHYARGASDFDHAH
ncbi:amino acid ABC transporter permease [Roseomonas marmotae]|uniref:Amino acid ABC transporter permease n=1 Tax=Roseomonas marmotae TaxID=2768161 RepID=A0ABS3K9N1_9PROT|nr:amino acid ABC transporter permease [Roseomonas marmotae]MBO1073338.1 amino acid ABC transporter permease [Roseomonas marmotae]QTI79048.1 amino acid ABC transporter permease [Roseomonas marmotae]